MKKFLIVILTVIALTVCLAACNVKDEMNILEFDQYKDMPASPAKIRVKFSDDLTGEYYLTDADKISEVMNLLLNEVYIKHEHEPGAGGNGYLKIYDESENYKSINLGCIEYRGYDYLPKSNGLTLLLRNKGIENGSLTTN